MASIKMKIAAIMTAACLMVPLFPVTGYASGAEASIQVSPQTIETGKIFTVTVTFTGTGDTIGTLQASLQYDVDKMEYKSGGGNAVQLSNGSGGISDNGYETASTMSYTLNFLALKSGTAHFAVTGSEIIGFVSSAKLGNPKADASITINDAPKPPQESQAVPDPLAVTVDGKSLSIQQNIEDIALPQGFELEKYFYTGKEIQAAINPAAALTLFFLLDEAGNGGFYIYDVSTGSIYPYYVIQTNVNAYMVLPSDATITGYEPTTIEISGQTVPVWKRTNGDTNFYIIYATNAQGTTGYYLYDATLDTVQRAKVNEVTAQTTGEIQTDLPATPPPENHGTILWTIGILSAVLLLLVIVLVILSMRFKREVHSDKVHKDRNNI